ncbi:MAG TPA: hypothetical protein DD437_12325 [Rhodobiaceae bacterium]|nr:hypothetical protein [Rhodobiaceae bacterium]|tara:strand:- start:4501 stop:5961 length:1461 start_codon:yes stop_codon:yes gene_type:complete
MKLLIIGMDGGHVDAFRRGWTPYMESLLTSGVQTEMNEDLVGRGWSKIITGEDGSKTGAIYDRPELNGTHEWSLRFKLDDIPGIGRETKTLWDKIGDRGYRVGIMNVPTAFPAPEVNGFFVSGGGGGGPVLQDPTEDLCYPRDIHSYLMEMGYIVDERLGSMIAEKGIYDADAFFQRLIRKNGKRAESFIELSQRFDIDFGFVVFKSSSNMAEFLLLPELKAAQSAGQNELSELTSAIKTYYEAFDGQVKHLCESFPDAEVLFVSDHGMAAREWSFNPNALLQEVGLQKPSRRNRGTFELVRFAKKLIPFSLRVAIRNNKNVKKAYESLVTFDSQGSQAFSTLIGDWRHGVYVNDDERFGGPVPASQKDTVQADIIDAISRHPEAIKHGVTASPRPNAGAQGSPHFPDVVLHVPDGYISSGDFNQSFRKFDMPPWPHEIASVTRGQLLCGKASNAMAVCVRGEWDPSLDAQDLTLIHHHALSRFPE